MTKDLRASQLQVSKIISSGSTGTGAKLVIYDISADTAASPNQGVIDSTKFNTGSIGTDIFLYVSGSTGKTNVANSNAISVFGGDVVISGNLNIIGATSITSSLPSFWFSSASNQIYTTGSILVSSSISTLSGTQSITFNTSSIGLQTNFIERLNISPTGITSALPILVPAGGTSAPTVKFTTDTSTGLYGLGGGFTGFAAAGADSAAIGNSSGNAYFQGRSGEATFTTAISNSAVTLRALNGVGAAAAIKLTNNLTATQATGTPPFVSLTQTYSQSSAAGYTFIQGIATETATGSGIKLLMDLQAGSTPSSKFTITNLGTVTLSGDLIVSGNLFVSASKKYAQYITVAGYLATAASSSNPQVAGHTVISQSEVNTNSIVLRGVLSSFTGSVSASLKLYNLTSGSYVEIGGTGITTLSTTNTTPTQVQSVNLMSAANFGTGSNIYETQVFTSNTSVQVYHGSSMFVCS